MELATIYARGEEGDITTVHSNPLHADDTRTQSLSQANTAQNPSDTDSLLMAQVDALMTTRLQEIREESSGLLGRLEILESAREEGRAAAAEEKEKEF